MATLSERLAFVLSLDSSGAIRGFQQVGDSAKRHIGDADDRLNRIGGRMQVAGAGAVAFAGIAGRALFGFAEASEEAHHSQLQLENTLRNSPRLAGETSASFVALADSIQDKTAADGDQIVSAMAMLGTFKQTGDQIRNVTPLVVDYARKFGVDLTSAAIQVGKALDGNVGALQRNGVSIDKNLFATDRYAAVTQALREQVGGFAEEEGKTFAGSLERLKNQLGDVAEGIGGGVVDAFTDMFGMVDGLVDRFKDLDPQTQKTIGTVAAWGTAALGAAGAASFLIGSVVKMKANFATAATSAQGFVGRLGGLKSAVGLATGALAIGTAAFMLWNDQQQKAARSAAELEQAIRDDAGAVGDHTRQLLAARIANEGWKERLDEVGISLDDIAVALNANDEEYARFQKRLEDAGPAVGILRIAFDAWHGDIQDNKQELADENALLGETTSWFQKLRVATADQTSELGDNTDAVEKNRDKVKEWRDEVASALDAFADPADAYQAKLEELTEAEQTRAEESAAAHNAAIDEQIAAIEEGLQAQLGALDESTDASGEAARALRADADSQIRALEDQKRGWEDFANDVEVSIDDYLASLTRQVQAQNNWERNLLIIASRAGSGVAKELAEMGPEGAALVAQFVNASDAQMQRLKWLLPQTAAQAAHGAADSLYRAAPVLAAAAEYLGDTTVQKLAAKLASGGQLTEHVIRNLFGGVLNDKEITKLLRAAGVPGFADGGVVPGPKGEAQVAVVHGGEAVFTPDQLAAMGHVPSSPGAKTVSGGTSGGVTVNLNVTFGGGARDPRQTVEELERYIRSNTFSSALKRALAA